MWGLCMDVNRLWFRTVTRLSGAGHHCAVGALVLVADGTCVEPLPRRHEGGNVSRRLCHC